jgi:hypothetical protein
MGCFRLVLQKLVYGVMVREGLIVTSLREAALALREWCDEAISFNQALLPVSAEIASLVPRL